MSRRPARTPCLGERVAALADGSLRADVRDRALAHTVSCPSCRLALEVERRTVAALRSLQAPPPSPHLVTQLIALGGEDGPLRPRRVIGPGMPGSVPIAAWPGPRAGSQAVPPGRRGARRARPRTVVAVAAGIIGVSWVAAGALAVTAGQTPALTAQLLTTPPRPTAPGMTSSSPTVGKPLAAKPLAAGPAAIGPAAIGRPAAWATPPGPGWAVANAAVAPIAPIAPITRGSSTAFVQPRRLPPALVAAAGR